MQKLSLLFLLFITFNISAQTKGGSIRRAENYATKKDYEHAAQQYQQKLKTDSNNYEANFEYGLLQTNYLHNPGEGGKFLLRAEHISKKDTASEIIYGLAQYYQYTEQYPKAINYYNRTFKFIEDDEEGTTLKTRINQSIADCEYAEKNPTAARHKQIRIINVGGGVNTIFPEYVPVVNKDETILMFTSRRKDFPKTGVDDKDDGYFEDMFIARKNKDGEFKDAHPFALTDKDVKDVPNTTKDHESVISISYNGNKFYSYRKNKIYESDLQNNTWSAPKALDTSINADIYQNHISMSNDGKTIYFSSERNGGEGKLDLYKAEKQADGKWAQAVNLGDIINTKDDEGSPLISEDGKTLYFSSKGHKGFGGYDIFKTSFNGTTWSAPENMNLPFNSAGDDIYMIINATETHGYLSSSRAGGYGDMDIYEITFLRAPFETYASDIPGMISFTAPDTIYVNQPLSFAVQSTKVPQSDIKTYNWGVNDSILQTHANNPSYNFSKEGNYKVRVEVQKNDNTFLSYEKNIVVVTKPVQLATNTFGLEPVYFNFNESTLDELATQAIEQNIKTLNTHPDAIIEISAFCDSRGSAAYNQILSERRAKAVIKYLKQKGFNVKRVKQVDWFGEKDPVNKCADGVPCTEDEYKLNRRAEFRLVK
ncbi:MAG TPA: OmpA family protein [Bacteroidia bacterium]|jgi:outer membrane protein OmpA-like peptidoglycan-associated protein/tetratricopeptide (TPR) repeat protein|nr:OmpA family protein [Bacteroidia bacterium]